jgi:hypothetical protein
VTLLWYTQVLFEKVLLRDLSRKYGKFFLQEAINYSEQGKNNKCNQYNTFQIPDIQNN